MYELKEYIPIIENLEKLLRELIEIESKKLEAAQKNKMTEIEECMKEEQAAVLKLRGLEMKREEQQKNMGLEGKKFREILELIPETEAGRLPQLFEALSREMKQLQSVGQSAQAMIEVNLHEIEKMTESGQRYKPGGEIEKAGRHITDRRI